MRNSILQILIELFARVCEGLEIREGHNKSTWIDIWLGRFFLPLAKESNIHNKEWKIYVATAVAVAASSNGSNQKVIITLSCPCFMKRSWRVLGEQRAYLMPEVVTVFNRSSLETCSRSISSGFSVKDTNLTSNFNVVTVLTKFAFQSVNLLNPWKFKPLDKGNEEVHWLLGEEINIVIQESPTPQNVAGRLRFLRKYSVRNRGCAYCRRT